MKIKAVIFDIEDTLYDSSLQMRMARLNAIRAMKDAGLPIDLEAGYKMLEEIVKEYGPHHTKHFDKLLERLGLEWNPRVIAAGVVAYRETSQVYLKPFPDTIPTLIKLRDLGYKLGVIAEGRSVKEWQKLIQLGVDHIFHSVLISEDLGTEEMSVDQFYEGTNRLNVKPEEAIYVSSKPNKGILYANRAGLITVRMRRGDSIAEEPKVPEARAKHTIDSLPEILDILDALNR
ncbi:TIGR02253 family HAD-type hydrolase [Candidatus Bathyarchaeota archaeon]|nr:MAG: TIGR02253 family HAD-type hydrolase [Candidatus Bathyarchaeota archaeon]